MTRAVLFDLDGTLADTVPDLGGALNFVLRRNGFPEKTPEEIRPHASHGANGLLLMGAGITPEHADHARWRQEFLDRYSECYADETALFAGINDLLAALAERGIAWGIITNKPARFTDKLVPKLGFAVPPAVVVSGDTCGEAKPSAKPMFYACEKIGVAPENCLYVGDAQRDMEAAKNAGMKAVLADWGYIGEQDDTGQWPQDARIAAPEQLLSLL